MKSNDNFLRIIKNSIYENKLQQVYLFSQLISNDFDEYIKTFINLVNDENFLSFDQITFGDNYYIVNSNNESIAKEEILSAITWATKSAINSKKQKILIIKNIENGSMKSLNSLLKFLENPPFNTIILMTTNQKNNVLKTIKSRSFLIDIKNSFANIYDIDSFLLAYPIAENEELAESKIKLKELSNLILQSNKKPETLIAFLILNFDKANAKKILIYMFIVYEDIYKNLLKSYKYSLLTESELNNKNFSKKNIANIVDLIVESYEIFSKNINFSIQKINFINKLEEIYEL
ncbi:DNA polymerase III [Metamycoplasma equirhinis]|uniref:DNA polymerase III n=1 Tax=Metamycoplasma equirhinis TaxID=92402 RepID=UPI003592FAB0